MAVNQFFHSSKTSSVTGSVNLVRYLKSLCMRVRGRTIMLARKPSGSNTDIRMERALLMVVLLSK